MLKVIVFDFDGVLVDSNSLKRGAFYGLLADVHGLSPELIETTWTESYGRSLTRFEFLNSLFMKIGKSGDELENLVKVYAAKYDDVVQRGIRSGGLMPGAFEVLSRLSEKYTLYINSATPDFALEKIVDDLGIRIFFKGIFGKQIIGFKSVSNSKELNLEKIFASENVSGDEVLFVGDGEVDKNAAEAYSCDFIGIANESNCWSLHENFKTIKSVADLDKIIFS